MNNVTVIDAIMGSGKTSWAIEYINAADEDENIIYVTPFLDEVKRIKTACYNRKILEPVNRGDGKLQSFKSLVSCSEDIAMTHELFKHLDCEAKQMIKDGHYTLMLDEVLDVVNILPVSKDDLDFLLDTGCISIDKDGFISWKDDRDYEDLSFSDINEFRSLAKSGNLMVINTTVLVWRYPPDIFGMFDKVYVMTYLFEASILKNYFDAYGIQYEKKSIAWSNGIYEICRYFEPDTSVYAGLINIYEGRLNDNFHQKTTTFSVTWFEQKQNAPIIKQIRNNVYNYFSHIVSAKSDSILWTTYADEKNKIKGKGYSKKFVAFNARSTNEYDETYNLAYIVNRYMNVSIRQFFQLFGITPDEDLYALSEMIQWIWRSRIRKGESVNIYIPSKRMRTLLKDWLYTT